MHEGLPPLTDWQNFYVIIGSAAAALMGLTFVVIALAANARRVSAPGLRAFVTPTIVHFGTVLVMAAFMTVPRQSVVSLSVGFAALGGSGLIYSGITAVSMRGIGSAYVPVGEDWLWHVALPTVIYAGLLVTGFLTRGRPEQSLYAVASASVLLLFIGIHNAWDVAVSLSVRPQDSPPSAP
jgi:hypothetical protein